MTINAMFLRCALWKKANTWKPSLLVAKSPKIAGIPFVAYLIKDFVPASAQGAPRRKLRFILPIPCVENQAGYGLIHFVANDLYVNSPKHGALKVDAVVVKKYSKGRYQQMGARWFAYAVGRLPKSVEAHQVFEMYRQRFGIEASYRQMNQVRARTTSRNPVVRLLLVGLAFVIFNLYIANREHIAICSKHPAVPASKHWLSLRRLAHMIAHAVENLFLLADTVFRHPRFVFS
jgi:putative transposase